MSVAYDITDHDHSYAGTYADEHAHEYADGCIGYAGTADRAAPREVPGRLATVTVLHRPSPASVAPPLRLTRRGVAAVSVVVGVLATALVLTAWASAPSSGASGAHAATPDTVVVHAGDTLWSIAGSVAPSRDPRAEVADLQRVNHLPDGAALVPGQVLRTH